MRTSAMWGRPVTVIEDGISIAANSGIITASDGRTDADLTHTAVAAEGGNGVNGRSDARHLE